MKNMLVGYVRRSKNGNAIKLSISADAFEKARKYTSQDGKEYVGLVINLEHLKDVVQGFKDVTSVCQIEG